MRDYTRMLLLVILISCSLSNEEKMNSLQSDTYICLYNNVAVIKIPYSILDTAFFERTDRGFHNSWYSKINSRNGIFLSYVDLPDSSNFQKISEYFHAFKNEVIDVFKVDAVYISLDSNIANSSYTIRYIRFEDNDTLLHTFSKYLSPMKTSVIQVRITAANDSIGNLLKDSVAEIVSSLKFIR